MISNADRAHTWFVKTLLIGAISCIAGALLGIVGWIINSDQAEAWVCVPIGAMTIAMIAVTIPGILTTWYLFLSMLKQISDSVK